jgi:hypothetical protein
MKTPVEKSACLFVVNHGCVEGCLRLRRATAFQLKKQGYLRDAIAPSAARFVRHSFEKHFITNLKAAGHGLLPQL